MGKLSKGLFTDCQETDQPQGSYRFAKNIVETNISEEKQNEPGFTSLGIPAPYDIIGLISIGDSIIVFSTDDTNSEIGQVTSAGVYTTLYNNADLNFDRAYPIKGEFEIDYRGHTVVAWIDKLNPPRIIDINDLSGISDIEDLLLFNQMISPKMSFTISNSGGSVVTASYFPITRYKDNSGSITPWYVHPRAIYIFEDSTSEDFDQQDGCPANTGTSKAINLTFTEVDTKYDKIEYGFISTLGGIVRAFSVREIDASATTNVTYTGSETITDLSIDEVLTSPASYSNARAITQLNNRLFLANLTSNDDIDFQYYANRIKINFSRDLVDRDDISKGITSPGFRSGEVYAFYILLELKSGKTLAYHIPGRPVEAGEKASIVDATAGLSYLKYQVDDTSDSASIYSNMSYWENIGEQYPSNFPTGINGSALAGQNVQHHRFPTMYHLVNTYYPVDATVGITKIPRLGIDVTGVNIPSDIRSRISRWRIAYAKKEYNNSLVVGQDIMQYAAAEDVDLNDRVSTGGNWSNIDPSTGLNTITLVFDRLRSHCLDLYYDRPSTVPSYIHFQYYLQTDNLNIAYTAFGGVGGMISPRGSDTGDSPGCVSNFTNTSAGRTDLGAEYRRAITNFEFVNPNSLTQGYISTYKTEGIITADIHGAGGGTTPPVWLTFTPELLSRSAGAATTLFDVSGGNQDSEGTFLYNFCQILDNVHSDFGSQQLIPTDGSSTDMTATSISGVHNGDCYICFQSYTSMGRLLDNDTIGLKGVRAFKWWLGEAKNNWGLRHEGAGVDGQYTPKTDPRNLWFPIATGSNLTGTIIDGFTSQVNQINYNIDYSAKNEYIPAVIIKNPLDFVTEFPNTVIFSIPQESESKSSWRGFLANDRYTQPRNKGEITNLQGINNLDLLVHHKYSLYKTRTNVGLSGDTADVVLRSANLFEISPIEIISNDSGFGGTQNPLSCLLTKVGYFFIDDLQGKVFLYTDKLEEISSNGLRNFFRDNLSVQEDNSFTSNGYTAWFDEAYNRLILSKKQGATSVTASFNPFDRVWISYHDYTPDGVVVLNNTSIFSVKDNELFTHNTGDRGLFYDASPYASIIDVVFNPDAYKKKVFSSIEWITEVYDSNDIIQSDETFDYVTVRNVEQCSGRIAIERLDNAYAFYDQNVRVLNRSWFFNGFRDIALTPDFLEGFYDNYEIDTTKLDSSMDWYEQRKFIDKFVTCRFEYLNTDGHKLIFLDSLVNYRPSAR